MLQEYVAGSSEGSDCDCDWSSRNRSDHAIWIDQLQSDTGRALWLSRRKSLRCILSLSPLSICFYCRVQIKSPNRKALSCDTPGNTWPICPCASVWSGPSQARDTSPVWTCLDLRTSCAAYNTEIGWFQILVGPNNDAGDRGMLISRGKRTREWESTQFTLWSNYVLLMCGVMFSKLHFTSEQAKRVRVRGSCGKL